MECSQPESPFTRLPKGLQYNIVKESCVRACQTDDIQEVICTYSLVNREWRRISREAVASRIAPLREIIAHLRSYWLDPGSVDDLSPFRRFAKAGLPAAQIIMADRNYLVGIMEPRDIENLKRISLSPARLPSADILLGHWYISSTPPNFCDAYYYFQGVTSQGESEGLMWTRRVSEAGEARRRLVDPHTRSSADYRADLVDTAVIGNSPTALLFQTYQTEDPVQARAFRRRGIEAMVDRLLRPRIRLLSATLYDHTENLISSDMMSFSVSYGSGMKNGQPVIDIGPNPTFHQLADAFKRGCPSATFHLGLGLLEGPTFPRSINLGKLLLLEAAGQGHQQARQWVAAEKELFTPLLLWTDPQPHQEAAGPRRPHRAADRPQPDDRRRDQPEA